MSIAQSEVVQNRFRTAIDILASMPAATMPSAARPATEPPPPWAVGSQWSQFGVRQPGWLLLPLRGFLGITFLYAGLQKLANPAYLRPSSPTSVVGQMTALRHSSPIGPLLGLSLHAPTLVGLTIAFGELAVAIGVLLGLWTRLAAAGGMALSLTFFLTVSWATTPYYYGSDIVFFFAWSVIAAFGSAGVLSLDSLFASRARQLSGLPATGPTYTVGGHRLRDLCNRAHECGLDPQTGCRNTIGCPLFGPEDRIRSDVAADVDRRRIVLAARSALVVGIGALGLGGLTAVIGRAVGGGSSQRGGNPLRAPAGPPTPHARHSAQPARHRKSSPANPPPGVAIGSTFQVPVGEAGRFTDPRSGEPAYVVHSAANTFVAFSAVCTHAGCVVGFDSSRLEFICPCHGGRYDAKTGQVVAGPPPSPLPPIPVHVVNGAIRVD